MCICVHVWHFVGGMYVHTAACVARETMEGNSLPQGRFGEACG